MNAAAKDTTNTLLLQPYIFFYGRCEEALEFYKGAIGGTYEFQRISESPMAGQFPADSRNRVMHGKFTGPGISFLVSDGRDAKSIDPDEGNISLALHSEDRATGDRVFAGLANGGKVTMPLKDAFWGGRFGSLVDRFGVEWMVTTP
ncbi:MAG TPA: VOC family protein [Candidatus Baltobacteraceae bacterium]|nr:VOC family protein [Candidatus Baltobacteraceae bacterium]